MKVGIYANIADPSAWGGAAHALLSLLKALGKYSAANDEFILFGPNEGSAWLAPALTDRVRLVQSPAKAGGSGWYRLQRWREHFDLARRPRLRSFFAPPESGYGRKGQSPDEVIPAVSNGFIESHDLDVIHFPFQDFLVTSLPSVFNPHDLQHIHLPKLWPADVIYFREAYYRFACNCATKVAVGFPWVLEDLVENFGLSRSKIALIPWGGPSALNELPTDQDVVRVRERYGLPRRFAFYAASPWPHKNHVNLLRAIHVLKQRGSELTLVLSGGENVYNSKSWSELRRTTSALHLDDRVKFVGYVATEDMRAMYRAASLVVVPTLFEAGSGPLAEAWVDDIPAACSDVPMLRSQAEDAAVFFDPLNPEAIASAMQRLDEDPKLRKLVVEAGRQRNAYYTWERTAHGYLDLYRELAARNPRM
jgi:glycosyltransferase involved in cell wall biosynthesis